MEIYHPSISLEVVSLQYISEFLNSYIRQILQGQLFSMLGDRFLVLPTLSSSYWLAFKHVPTEA